MRINKLIIKPKLARICQIFGLVMLSSCLMPLTAVQAQTSATQTAPLTDSQWIQDKAWRNWPIVGQANLSWMIFDVYQSQLATPSGRYQQGDDVSPHRLALEIEYQRDITKAQLLDATQEQWQKMGYTASEQSAWLAQLSKIFPDIKEGQRIIYVSDGASGVFYYDDLPSTEKNAPSQIIGHIDDEKLNDAFLSIWLSANSKYPKLRNKLIGN